MSLPEDKLSTVAAPAEYSRETSPRSPFPRKALSFGGVALQDASLGLAYQLWTAEVIDDVIYLSSPNTPAISVHNQIGITSVQFAFDRNMNPAIVFTTDTTTYVKWWTSSESSTIKDLGGSLANVLVSIDEWRQEFSSDSDIILSYLDDTGRLCYRQQRELFDVERVLDAGPYINHTRSGMNNGYRFQFETRIEVNDYVD